MSEYGRRKGTDPEMVWGKGGGDLCKSFIDFMEGEDFRGSIKLVNRSWLGRWSIRGYGVGALILGSTTFQMSCPSPSLRHRAEYNPKKRHFIGSNLPHNIFLCEDALLRHYVSGRTNFAGFDKSGAFVEEEPPSFIADLPRSRDGSVVTLVPGYFDARYKAISYTREVRPAPGAEGMEDSGATMTYIYGDEEYGCFVQDSLRNILTNYAASSLWSPRRPG